MARFHNSNEEIDSELQWLEGEAPWKIWEREDEEIRKYEKYAFILFVGQCTQIVISLGLFLAIRESDLFLPLVLLPTAVMSISIFIALLRVERLIKACKKRRSDAFYGTYR